MVEWLCHICGDEASYRSDGQCYCKKHWEEIILKDR